MKNLEIARLLDELADALEFHGENPFKVSAYRRAAKILRDFTEDIEVYAKEGRLQEIPGIGEGIAKKIKEYLETGKITKHKEVISKTPREILELLKIPSLGPKTLKLAHDKLGVKNLDDLKRVIEDGSLARLPGMGPKKVENIKKGIELYEGFTGEEKRWQLGLVIPVVTSLVEEIKKFPGVKKVVPAGSYRRMKETVGDIDILCIGEPGGEIIKKFTELPVVERVLACGETKGSIIEKSLKIQIDLRVVPERSFGAALQYFTGSKAHNIKLRTLAKGKGYKISEYGVFKGEKYIAGETEEDVYAVFGLPWIPPELREDRGEIELALEGKLPRLVEYDEIKGDFHIHSKYSDGANTIEEIAKKAEEMGLEYIAICDHSRSLKYAGGLDIDTLKRRNEEIDRLNEKFKIKILKGMEVDILQDGSLDYPDPVLEELDVVIAAIHMGFKKNVTERILAAMENPLVDIIAHPTGRLISGREGYDVDLEKIMERARELGVALEINAYFDRLDLDEHNARKAKELGIKLAIGTDAHNVGMLQYLRLGVGIARRAWLSPSDLLNTLSWKEYLKKRRRNG